MLIRTNIGQVIARLKRLDEALHQALRKAAESGYWKPRLEWVATKTIRAQWASERSLALRGLYEKIAPRVVATITAEAFDHGTRFTMTVPYEAILPPISIDAAAAFNIGQRTPTGRLKKSVIDQGLYHPKLVDREAIQNLERVRQMILDWVMLEKERDTRDQHADGTPLSDEEIAERIGAILGIGRSGVIPRERTQTVDDAAVNLTRAIERWLDGEGNSPPPNYDKGGGFGNASFTPEVAAQWLQAVLLAWQKFMLASLPARISDQMQKVLQSIGKELL